MIDLAPTFAALLGVELKRTDGRAVPEFCAKAADRAVGRAAFRSGSMKVPIFSNTITQVLAGGVVCLSLVSLAGQYYTHFLGDYTFWLRVATKKLDVNQEYNLPTWYQRVSLFSCFLLLTVIAAAARAGADRYTRHWVILTLVFLYLSADEFLVIHERLDALRSVFPTRDAFYYTWVIPAAFLVLLFALAYLKFLFHLPDRTRSLFIAAGALYVGGALGMEMVTGSAIDSRADILAAEETFNFAVLNAIEEFLEMGGIVVFVNGLLSYLNLHPQAGEVTASRAHVPVYLVA